VSLCLLLLLMRNEVIGELFSEGLVLIVRQEFAGLETLNCAGDAERDVTCCRVEIMRGCCSIGAEVVGCLRLGFELRQSSALLRSTSAGVVRRVTLSTLKYSFPFHLVPAQYFNISMQVHIGE
jgi:hypothetical protein